MLTESKLTRTLQRRHLTSTCTAAYIPAPPCCTCTLISPFMLPTSLTPCSPFNFWPVKASSRGLWEKNTHSHPPHTHTHRENSVFSIEPEVLTVVVSMWGITQVKYSDIILTAYFNLCESQVAWGLLSQNNSDGIRKINRLNLIFSLKLCLNCLALSYAVSSTHPALTGLNHTYM